VVSSRKTEAIPAPHQPDNRRVFYLLIREGLGKSSNAKFIAVLTNPPHWITYFGLIQRRRFPAEICAQLRQIEL
jgi:hypothetical protein